MAGKTLTLNFKLILEKFEFFFWKKKTILSQAAVLRLCDSQHNATQHNDIQYYDTQHNGTHQSGTQHKDTQLNEP